MLDDAAGSIGTVSALLEAELGKAIAVAIDQAALIGTGVGGQPMGLYNTPGVSQTLLTSPNGSTLANYQFLITAVGVVRSGNFEPSAVIYDARTDKQLNSLVTGIAGDLRQLAIPEPIASMPRLVTNQIGDAMTCGTSSDCSAAFVGDYSQLVVGVRPSLGVRVLVDPYTTASTGQIRLFAWTRCDVGVLNTSAFAVVSGLRA
jgi:HK97 family phage major capsid protein